LEVENVFKIAVSHTRVREFLASRGWVYQGKHEGMDYFRNQKTRRQLFVEDISDDFPVTFLMGGLNLAEFSDIANTLAPGIMLLEVDSSWEGKPATIVVAMTEAQVRDMFGRRTRIRRLPMNHNA
jgi:hypothetical protein